MVYFSPIEMHQKDFTAKLEDFLENPQEQRLLVNLNKEELSRFKKRLSELEKEFLKSKKIYPSLTLACVSEANILGCTSSLCIFEKCTA